MVIVIHLPFIALQEGIEFDGHFTAKRHSVRNHEIGYEMVLNRIELDDGYLLCEDEQPVLMRWLCVFSRYSSSSESVKNHV